MSAPSRAEDATIDPVRRLADDLHQFERLLRQTIAVGARLTMSATEAHADRNLSATVGNQVFVVFSGATSELSNTLASVGKGHRMLDALGRSLGLDVTAYGDGQKQPAPGFADIFTSAQDICAAPTA